MNYDNLTDLEINKMVARQKGFKDLRSFGRQTSIYVHDIFCYRDYCNNWSDVGPLIVDNKISINFIKLDDSISATTSRLDSENFEFYDLEVFDKNPLRAVCIVYLMMKEKE